jgi:glycosyltransferase involved in cell wall biosynthesis
MKILFVTNGYPPHRWAGTETYTAGIAEEFQRRDYEVQILCVGAWEEGLHPMNGFSDDIFHAVPVRRLNLNWTRTPDPFRYLYNNPIILKYFTNYLKEIKPSLVHVTSCETLSASVLKAVKDAQIPLALTLTDFWFLCPRINLLKSDGINCNGITSPWQCLQCQLRYSKAYRWPRRFLPERAVSKFLMQISKFPRLTRQPGLRGMAGDMQKRKAFLSHAITLPDIRITASSFAHDIFISNHIQAPITLLPYGHDLSWLKGYVGKTSSERIRVGYIGQINHAKGVHLLIEAVNCLSTEYGNEFILSIFGDMEQFLNYCEKLRHLTKQNANIEFRGTYPRSRSAWIFSEIDVLVVPSLWYDFPLIIYEAFATRTPVITTNLGGMAEAVKHDVNGLLFERGNINDLKNQLQRCITEPNLLSRLQASIPPVMQIDDHVNDLEKIYSGLIHQRKDPS